MGLTVLSPTVLEVKKATPDYYMNFATEVAASALEFMSRLIRESTPHAAN